MERIATCRCGQLQAKCQGEPIRVSVCHCLECKKRSGSAFAYQARWPDEQVEISGESSLWSSTGDGGGIATFRFCPRCSCTIAYVNKGMPDEIAIPVGAFADPNFPAPHFSVYEERRHAWVAVLGDHIERWD